ncbi:DUF397 domain-containing protein [Actinomadura sp. BRA 177]|nr:DUF397 domain-containing protein [Actinomadura sp. BRA 177]
MSGVVAYPPRWRKSSHSHGGGTTDCVEVAAVAYVWRKSSHSQTGGATDCVELAGLVRGVGVRDSKDVSGPCLVVVKEQFAGLVARVKAGRYDL